jgi:carboxypeptidase D
MEMLTTSVSNGNYIDDPMLIYTGNWIGNEAVVDFEIKPPGWSSAGYVDISTSDDVVHGQVKQSASFAFARIYEAGHEVPFYQPVVALEMFERAITGYDIATGTTKVAKGSSYKTTGPPKSTYREGGATVQHKVLPTDSTYNTTTNAPNPPSGNEKRSTNMENRRRKRSFRPFPRM